MEPTNNPMPTANPVSQPVQPMNPAQSAAPVQSVAPAQPIAPVQSDVPVQPPMPADSAVSSAPMDTPVAPVITPGSVNPIAESPFFQPNTDVLLDTSPITMPEAPKAPDPEEVELSSPLTPAAPVPGSIGSAVSVPPSDSQQRTPSVAFTDPATQENPMANVSAPAPVKAKGPKQPINKTTLILIGVVAVLVIVALVVILMSMNS